jgi:hypothetical protein
MKNKTLIVFLSFFVAFGLIADESNDDPKEEEAKEESKKDDRELISEFVEEFVSYEGLLKSYQDPENGNTYLELSDEDISKEFIYFAHIINGTVEAGLFKGSHIDQAVIKFEKQFNSLNLIRVNTGFYFNPNSELSRQSQSNISDSVIENFEITHKNDDETTYLIDITKLLKSDNLTKLKSEPRDYDSDSFGVGSLSRSKTAISKIYNYPKNTDFEVDYVFSNPASYESLRNTSVKLRYTFLEMPQDNGFEIRFEDPRIGYFTDRVTDLSSTEITPYRDLVQKWNLQKQDPDAAKSKPIKPIKFWLENTTPNELRPLIIKAVLAWNLAFEKAGFIDAIEVDVQPDDADWDAGDIRYNVLRWTSSPNPPFGGYGPSFSNPRTGEILSADIMLEWIFLTNRMRYEDIFLSSEVSSERCNFSSMRNEQRIFGNLVASSMDFSIEDTEKLFDEELTMLILHEVGHTLGLNHNMGATTLHNNDDVHNAEITYKEGLSASVMDYHAINIAPPGVEQGQFSDVKPGLYDQWAIEFAYTPNLSDEEIQKILNRSQEKGHFFGNDADDMRSPGRGIDPRVNIGDMSDDPVEYAIGRYKLVQEIMPGIVEKIKSKSDSWESVYQSYFILMRQIMTSMDVVSRQIGGVYVTRHPANTKSDKKPYEAVPYKVQKQAMETLNNYAFSSEGLKPLESIAAYMQRERRGFDFYDENEDPKFHDYILSGHKRILNHLTNKDVLRRITDSAFYGNEYNVSEMMSDLTKGIFPKEKLKEIDTITQNLQATYLSKLITITNLKKYDEVAQSAAFGELLKIQKLLRRQSSNDETRSHKKRLSLQIDKKLTA